MTICYIVEKKHFNLYVYPTPRNHSIVVENRNNVMCNPQVHDASCSWDGNDNEVVTHLKWLITDVLCQRNTHSKCEISIMTPTFYICGVEQCTHSVTR